MLVVITLSLANTHSIFNLLLYVKEVLYIFCILILTIYKWTKSNGHSLELKKNDQNLKVIDKR